MSEGHYHCRTSIGSIGGGQSAGAKFRYNEREKQYARDADGNQRDPLIHSESGNMPAWAQSPTDYWDAADGCERKNGRLFREYEIALPVEMTDQQRINLAREITQKITGNDLPYSLAIHFGKGTNPHLHLLVSERMNDGIQRTREKWFKRASVTGNPADGGARKTARLQSKDSLKSIRELVASLTNNHLENIGSATRVDHRSHIERGIHKMPGVHLGPKAAGYEKRTGKKSRRTLAAESKHAEYEAILLLKKAAAFAHRQLVGLDIAAEQVIHPIPETSTLDVLLEGLPIDDIDKEAVRSDGVAINDIDRKKIKLK